MLLELSPDPSLLRFEEFVMTERVVTIHAVTVAPAALCPCCQRPSQRIHSTYRRHPQDLACQDRAVQLVIVVRRFFCEEPDCSRRIFTERLGAVLAPYARKTARLLSLLATIVVHLGGEAGSRLLTALHLTAAPSTLLRIVRAQPLPLVPTPTVLGVDDWALRKGQTYATVLVDLQAHQIIDLLPDRSSETFAAWLRAHPGVQIISRDRGGAYAKGAREGAPDAQQVADRWHLLHNLTSALKQLMHRHHPQLRDAAHRLLAPPPDTPEENAVSTGEAPQRPETRPSPAPPDTRPPSKCQVLRQQRQQALQERYARVQELAAQGLSVHQITKQLGMVRRTVKKYLREVTPLPRHRRTPSSVEPYRSYLQERWTAGCTNTRQLWEELQAKGFSGSMQAVKRLVRPWRDPVTPIPTNTAMVAAQTMTARKAVWLFLRTTKPAAEEIQRLRDELFRNTPLLGEIAEHVVIFQDMLVGRRRESLSWWMERARALCPELGSFAKGLEQDQQAVENAIGMPWSQGPTEGFVNRIKTIKRQMYGRASLDLLRRRLIGSTTATSATRRRSSKSDTALKRQAA